MSIPKGLKLLYDKYDIVEVIETDKRHANGESLVDLHVVKGQQQMYIIGVQQSLLDSRPIMLDLTRGYDD